MSEAASLPKAPPRLDPQKFRDPGVTAKGERRAHVALSELRTLWINTGTLCNLTCNNCYIESSPANDRLVYITAAEAAGYFDEIARDELGTKEIGFTGGEPFLNPEIVAMMADALARGFEVLVLTNAMKPMMNRKTALLDLREKYGGRLTIRVSLDHYGPALHEMERGPETFQPTLDGLRWLAQNGFRVHVAGRTFGSESANDLRRGYARLFAENGIGIDAGDPSALVLFPEMDSGADVPEITEHCWDILHVDPRNIMCAASRMVVKRKGAERPAVLACTLIAYDPRFELGATLKEASRDVALNHPHCARFCVLGGASCSRA
jgi:MoaA/NifB/PqqE/SkfB family radical SAM enzyme